MHHLRPHRPTPALVVSIVALVIALGGVAYATIPAGFGHDTGHAAAGNGAECTLGEMILSASPSVTNGMPANGQVVQISHHVALFSLLGTTYGGDGKTTFALPDMRSVTPDDMTYSICDRGQFPAAARTRSKLIGGSSSATVALRPAVGAKRVDGATPNERRRQAPASAMSGRSTAACKGIAQARGDTMIDTQQSSQHISSVLLSRECGTRAVDVWRCRCDREGAANAPLLLLSSTGHAGGEGLAAAFRWSGNQDNPSSVWGVSSGGLGSGPVERAGQRSALEGRERCLLSCCSTPPVGGVHPRRCPATTPGTRLGTRVRCIRLIRRRSMRSSP